MSANWQQRKDSETQTEYALRLVREEPLRGLLERLDRAVTELEPLIDQYWEIQERTRIRGKIEGVRLVRSYIEEGLR